MKQPFLMFLSVLTLLGFGQADAASVTLYTAGPPSLADNIAKSFTEKSGTKVEVYQATSGDVLARLDGERARPRADVVVLASWGEGLIMREQGRVEAYRSSNVSKLRNEWVDGGLSAQGGSALAVVVNVNQVSSERYPKSWFDLTLPYWKDGVTMPDPTLSGSAAEFVAVFVQNMGDKGWKLFENLARNGLLVPGSNNATLNPVLSGAKKATIAAVDHTSYEQVAKGERLAILYPNEGTVVALRPIFVQVGAPHPIEARKLVDFMLSQEGQTLAANAFLIPSRIDTKAQRPMPSDFKMLPADWNFLKKNQSRLVSRFRREIVEGIIQKR